MCRLNVEVVVVKDDQLAAPWASAKGDDGRRVLFVRKDADPLAVVEGYQSVLRECPIRIALGNHLSVVA